MTQLALRNLFFVLLAVTVFAVLDFLFLGFMPALDRGFLDLLQKMREQQLQPDPAIVQLHIDERSLELLADELGRYPWPRAVHAELLHGLLAAEPAAVVFDIVFSDPDRDRPGSDDYFVEVAAADPRVFFAQVLLENKVFSSGVPLDRFGDTLGYTLVEPGDAAVRQAMTLPLPALAATGRLGSINFFADSDGIGRRYVVYKQRGGWRIPSLPMKVAQYLKYPIPDEAFIRLNWSAHPGERVQHSYADVLRLARDNDFTALSKLFADRVVIIGGNAPGLHDFRATPLAGDFPGTGILATAIENLKHESYLQDLPTSVTHAVAGGLLL
ncbi:MAG: CHASE2 domain-containing protein, partial [Gammaproteobacteria bacterium]